MTYRDDQDALLARNDALEDENERLRAELEAARAPKPPPAPAPTPPGDRRGAPTVEEAATIPVTWRPTPRAAAVRARLRPVLTTLAVLLVMAACAYGIYWSELHTGDDEIADDATTHQHNARAAARTRWRALVAAEPCIDQWVVVADYVLGGAPDRYDPRDPHANRAYRSQGSELESLTRQNCTDELQAVAGDRAFDADTRAVVRDFLAVDRRLAAQLAPLVTYLEGQDWQDDGYAGALRMWRDAAPTVDAWIAKFERTRAAVAAATHALVGRLLAGRERAAGRDLVWWRLRTGLAQRELAEACVHAFGAVRRDAPARDRDAIADALVAPAAAFERALDGAPVEVRRRFRSFDPVAYVRGVYDPGESIGNLVRPNDDLLLDFADDDAPLLVWR